MRKNLARSCMRTLGGVCQPALVAIVGATVLLSGCTQGASESEVAQAKRDATQAQVQKDVQASLSAEVKKLQDDAAQAAEAKNAAAKAAEVTAAAAAKAAKAQSELTSCGGNLSAGANTTCAFASNVESTYYQNGGGNSTFDVYSPVTGLYYTMTCTAGVPTECRGGNNAVVYIR
jgi:biotin carboxyl carrier protein